MDAKDRLCLKILKLSVETFFRVVELAESGELGQQGQSNTTQPPTSTARPTVSLRRALPPAPSVSEEDYAELMRVIKERGWDFNVAEAGLGGRSQADTRHAGSSALVAGPKVAAKG